MSRSTALFQEYLAARREESTLLKNMNTALKAVCGNRAAEEVVHLLYIPKLDKANKTANAKQVVWRAAVEREFVKGRLDMRPSYFDHPERADDEIFLGNYTSFAAGAAQFDTKRLGVGFKDGLGDRPSEEELFPVFIKIAEAKRRGIIKSQ